MSTNLSQTTSQRQVLQQRLILTQELQLFLKLIQMTTLELKDYLEEQLVENPTLEEAEETADKSENGSGEEGIDFGSVGNSRLLGNDNGDMPHYSSRQPVDEGEDEPAWENRIATPDSLNEHLTWQLEVSDLTQEEKQIGSIIIGNTNEDGYLEIGPEEIGALYLSGPGETVTIGEDGAEVPATLPESEAVMPDRELVERIEQVLYRIQTTFDPTGTCSRDLKECLRIQALDLGYTEDCVIMKIIEGHLGDLDSKDFFEIADYIGCSAEDVKEAVTVISTLEPKPGRPYYDKDPEKFITPDFYVYKVGNELQVQLNREFPKVRISSYYRSLLKKEKSLPPEAKLFLKEKLEAAQRIMKCLDEREAAVKKIIAKIVEVQKDFFEHGKDYIKPLILKDVAQSVGVHESTVSRVTSRRYIQTPQGTIELKALFSRKIETSHGKEVSFERVKSMIREIVAEELPESPYSDEDISKILERRNVIVARRTVAKYRKTLKIPSSSTRAAQKGKKRNES
ncbi:MAG TPA: RNA polymerase factor sigma-54 [Thermodesulfobacteriota bacterium]|nr:RNA polymerase factor sigma-54 [Thermodesulfobacteriota bacterium]